MLGSEESQNPWQVAAFTIGTHITIELLLRAMCPSERAKDANLSIWVIKSSATKTHDNHTWTSHPKELKQELLAVQFLNNFDWFSWLLPDSLAATPNPGAFCSSLTEKTTPGAADMTDGVLVPSVNKTICHHIPVFNHEFHETKMEKRWWKTTMQQCSFIDEWMPEKNANIECTVVPCWECGPQHVTTPGLIRK